jgi:hypothetical protein
VQPIILYNFEIFSGVSYLANLLVLPILPITMLFVFFASVFGFFFEPISWFFGQLAYVLLLYEVEVLRALSLPHWSAIGVKGFGAVEMVVWYVCAVVGIVFLRAYGVQNNQRRLFEQ